MRGKAAAVLGAVTAFVLSVAPSAHAATVEVFPGPNAIQNAVNAASAGDTLLIHAGTYHEHVNVGSTKTGLTLRGFGDGAAIVDAGCAAFTAIDVNANGVRIDGLRIRGGTYYEVDFNSVINGAIMRSLLRDTCQALYGVNVYGANGGPTTVSGNVVTGFADAGIYIGGIIGTGGQTLLVAGNRSFGNNRGIIVEDINNDAHVTVSGNRLTANRAAGESALNAGIFLHNADAVVMDANVVMRNGDRGIELDANSSLNVVTNNTIDGHIYDLSNLGSNNCFSNNTYTTSNGPLPACL